MRKRAIAGARRCCGISARAGPLLLQRQACGLHRLVVMQPTRLPLQDEKFHATAAIIAWNHAKRSMAQSPRKNFSPACIESRPSTVLDLDLITSWKC